MGWLGKFFSLFKSNEPKVGDIVVCIDDRNWNTPQTDIRLIYNKAYKIYDIIEDCHFYGYDIGAKLTPSYLFTICNCGKPIRGIGIHWVLAKRFRLATSEECIEWLEDELKYSIQDEDYIRASEIKKELERKRK